MTTIKDFFKYSRRNTVIEINGYDCGDYATFKRDFRSTDFFNRPNKIISWDACDYIGHFTGEEYTIVAAEFSNVDIEIKSANADKVNDLVDKLNDSNWDDVGNTDRLIKKIEKLLPHNVWLNYDGAGYFALRYQANDHQYYFPVDLVQR